MSKLSVGAKRLKEILEKSKPAEVAVALDCTVTTVYNLVGGGDAKPSLHVANKAKESYRIPTESWEIFS